MRSGWIRSWIAVPLLAATAPAATLYEKDGISLEGTVRMAGRNAATCQVLAESESPESYEATKANHGRPLHVWRLDYSAFNGSGKRLSQITAHFRIQSEWPPCTNWTGLGQYPGPVQWASSFETIQRTGGMQPAELATATAYVLAIDGQQPRFSRWQLDFRFGAVTVPSGPPPEPPAPVQPEPSPVPFPPEPDCEDADFLDSCWLKLANPPNCYLWRDLYTFDVLEWDGECPGGLAAGTGILVETIEYANGGTDSQDAEGLIRAGKQQDRWTYRLANDVIEEGPYVDGTRQGRWAIRWPDGATEEGPYVDGWREGHWTNHYASGAVAEGAYVRGEEHGVWRGRSSSGKTWETPYANGVRHGRYFERSANGFTQAGNYVRGEKDGPWVARWPSGITKTIVYKDGKSIGSYDSY